MICKTKLTILINTHNVIPKICTSCSNHDTNICMLRQFNANL